jgi:BlaI family transcriptional regulator, penicillinase repressor
VEENETFGLTELQLAILHVLWGRGEATSRQVREALMPSRSLALTTVATLLSRLEKKGVLDHRRQGRAHVFRPTVTQIDVRRNMVRELADNLFEGKASQLMGHLLLSGNLDSEELRLMRQALDDAARGGREPRLPEGGAPA